MSLPNLIGYIFDLDLDGTHSSSQSQLEIQSQTGQNFSGTFRQSGRADVPVTGSVSEGSYGLFAFPQPTNFNISFAASSESSSIRYVGAIIMQNSLSAFMAGTFTESQTIDFRRAGFPAGGQIIIDYGPFPFCSQGGQAPG